MTNERHAVGGRSETSGVIAWPWWAHQGSEYLVALLLISEAAHAEVDRAALGALGLLLAVLTAVTEGPLGILDWFSVRLHRALDFFVVAILIAAPVLLNFHAIIGIITVESAGLALLWMTLHTQTKAIPRRRTAVTIRQPSTAASHVPSAHIAYRAGRAVRRSSITGPRNLGRVVGRYIAVHRPEGRG